MPMPEVEVVVIEIKNMISSFVTDPILSCGGGMKYHFPTSKEIIFTLCKRDLLLFLFCFYKDFDLMWLSYLSIFEIGTLAIVV